MKGYTQIDNTILEALISSNLSAAELKVALAFIRKINGYHKASDQISYSQLMKITDLSRQTISNCLTQLRLVNIIRLVKKGSSSKVSNEWTFNQNINEWKLVKRTRLVKWNHSTSQKSSMKLVKSTRHTKENTKENIIQKKEDLEIIEKDKFTLEMFLNDFNSIRKYFLPNSRGITIVDKKTRKQFIDLTEQGVSRSLMQKALKALFLDQHHRKNNWTYCTPEFITRPDKYSRFSMIEDGQHIKQGALGII